MEEIKRRIWIKNNIIKLLELEFKEGIRALNVSIKKEDFHYGEIDMLVCQSNQYINTLRSWIFIKIVTSVEEFASNKKSSTVYLGNYNYIALPKDVYDEVYHAIPDKVGVYIYDEEENSIRKVKKGIKEEMHMDIGLIEESFSRALEKDSIKLKEIEIENNSEAYKRVNTKDNKIRMLKNKVENLKTIQIKDRKKIKALSKLLESKGVSKVEIKDAMQKATNTTS